MSTYRPEIAEREVVKETTLKVELANPLPKRTKVKVTLGRTVVYGSVEDQSDAQYMVMLLEGAAPANVLLVYYASGWEIEVLDDDDR